MVVLATTLIAFLLFRFVGDPVAQMVGQDTLPAERAALRKQLGLEDSFSAQFLRYLGRIAQGDLGYSLRTGRPVATTISERIPASVELAIGAALLALVIGLMGGIAAAVRPRGAMARVITGFAGLGMAIPSFLVGSVLILVFGVYLGWLPVFGRGETMEWYGWTTGLATAEGRAALVLPAITLALFPAALVTRFLRAELRTILDADYIRTARSLGLPPQTIYWRHALPNALAPMIAIGALQLGALLAFAVVTEAVFQWPGLGSLLLQSIQFADVAVLAAYLPLTALTFLAINLLADIGASAVDPRVRDTRP